MKFFYTLGLGILGLCLLCPIYTYATHVRAGEITTRRLSPTSLTYEITLTAYFDEIRGRAAADDANRYIFCFGDGSQAEVQRSSRRFINGRTSSINTYTITHTFPGPGVYTIGIQIPNRNADTKNLPPAASSDNIIFYVSTTIVINPALQINSTPVMLNPPLDSAQVGQRFCHNPAAFDVDGDSLAYRLSVPKDAPGNPCISRNYPNYQNPTQYSRTSESGGPASFSINASTGELCWDAPGEEGQYNFAFIVEEWRNGVLIGEITRDMQIIVVDQPNRRPQIQPLAELCVEAGTLINQTITATDPDGHRVIITAFGGPFNTGPDNQPLPNGQLVPPAYARLLNGGIVQNQPAQATFSWQTNCNQLRDEPYDITLKVTDVPPRPIAGLVSFQTLRIRLIGPAVQGLTARPTAQASRRAVLLNWQPYACGAQGTQLIVYRKEGCTPDSISPCTTGAPPGYVEVARLPQSATTYTDTAALRRGIGYAYRIVARYPGANGGFSVASAQQCLELPLLAPVITQVTVDSTGSPTSRPAGQITVRWSRPLGLQPGDLGGPYQYRLLRAEGLTGTAFTPVATINTSLAPGVADTVFVDRTAGLNTQAQAYRYQLEFYYTSNGTLTRLDATEPASSVRLSVTAGQRQLSLSWQASVPWSNQNQTHRIYRSRTGPNGPFNLIAEVAVQGPASFTFVDTGTDTYAQDGTSSGPLSADSSYCYRVLTRGRYADARLAGFGLLENYSQIQCAAPIDSTRPCAPALRVDSLDCASLSSESLCNQTSFVNRLSWQLQAAPNCDVGVVRYRIYYARYEQDELARLDSVAAPGALYEHGGLSTVAGCYQVTAVSRRGLESAPSNKVCVDACPALVLPNVFTPNGDGKNDVFAPLRCARFVESVELEVFNRWGARVYQGSGPVLSWDGRSSRGEELSSGLYYYQVRVRYAVVDRNAPAQVLKGWVQLIRDGVSMR